MDIKECEGYKSLLAAVERDYAQYPSDGREWETTLLWAVDRANNYAEKTGLEASDILDSWEKDRTYWYRNYYQECNQPEIKGDSVRVFDTVADLLESIGDSGFRCPACKGISKSPYKCSCDDCDWKSYGLFGTLGEGVSVFVKEKVKVDNLFMPVAWEK